MCLVIILRGNGYMTNNQLTKIEIDNYKAFNGFVMRLCPQEGLNLNLLIGRNGSGKSSFLDALAEIACNNLTSAPDKSVDNTSFQYGLTLKSGENKQEINNIQKTATGLWDKVVRFYTGYTERAFEEKNQNIISGNSETFRKALWAYLAGGFNTQDDNWHKLINLIFNNNFTKEPINTLKIKALWIDTINIITKESLDDGETEVSDVKKHELHRFELNDNEIISNDCLLNSYGANIIDIGQILFKMEGNIGERAKDEIEKLLNSNSKKDIEKIERLLSEVGPGEYRWRLRAKLQELMSQKKVTVPVCPLVRKRRKYA